MAEQVEQNVKQAVRNFLQARNRCWIEPDAEQLLAFSSEEVAQECLSMRNRWFEAGKERGINYVSAVSDCQVGKVNWWTDNQAEGEVDVLDATRWLYQTDLDLEEEERQFKGTLRLQRDPNSGDLAIVDMFWKGENAVSLSDAPSVPLFEAADLNVESWRVPYNRMNAFKYAELYWNSANPQYKYFEVDCTNYVSQVMAAGGFPLEWSKSKSKGWWYRHAGGKGDSWSYSWAVAHSLKVYLEHSPKVQQVEDPRSLEVGDVICYDWDGDGHWQHNTVVVGFERRGYPLVNAHTVNSRRRFFSYQDSYAYTPNTQYSFFHIIV